LDGAERPGKTRRTLQQPTGHEDPDVAVDGSGRQADGLRDLADGGRRRVIRPVLAPNSDEREDLLASLDAPCLCLHYHQLTIFSTPEISKSMVSIIP